MTAQRLIDVAKSETLSIDERYPDYHSSLISMIVETIQYQSEEISEKKRIEKIRYMVEKKIEKMSIGVPNVD